MYIFILVLAIINFIHGQAQEKRCFENVTLGTQEFQLTQQIKDLILKNEKFDQKCLEVLIQRGFYKSALVLFEDYFLTNKIDLHESMHKLTSTNKKYLDKFLSLLWSSRQQIQQVEPFIKWVQNQQHIFLHIKLSMRSDSPACVHCKLEKIEFTNSTLYMSSYGIQSHQPIRFVLNLTLLQTIDPQKSTWKEDSVGTIFIDLYKHFDEEELNNNFNNSNQSLNVTESLNNSTTVQVNDNNKLNSNNTNNSTINNSQNGNNNSTDTNNNKKDEEEDESDEEKNRKKEEEEKKRLEQEEREFQQDSKKIWLRLEKNERNVPIWWDMRDKHLHDMKVWEKMCERDKEQKKKKLKEKKEEMKKQREEIIRQTEELFKKEDDSKDLDEIQQDNEGSSEQNNNQQQKSDL